MELSDPRSRLDHVLIELLFPPRCPGCGSGGAAACPACLVGFGPPRRVSVRGVPVFTLADHAGAARALLLAFKERGRRDLAAVLGALLAAALPLLPLPPGPVWFVPAPSTRRAARRRGGSHVDAALRGAGVPRAPVLGLASGVVDSVGLTAAQRRANLRGRVLLRAGPLPPPGAVCVVVDDVVTTGATVLECARVLRSAGFRVPLAVTFTSARRTEPDG
ncbi:hypothetical protein GCM10010428_65330 [Actinosynnema pretiosum subsp. pretiosum]